MEYVYKKTVQNCLFKIDVSMDMFDSSSDDDSFRVSYAMGLESRDDSIQFRDIPDAYVDALSTLQGDVLYMTF